MDANVIIKAVMNSTALDIISGISNYYEISMGENHRVCAYIHSYFSYVDH